MATMEFETIHVAAMGAPQDISTIPVVLPEVDSPVSNPVSASQLPVFDPKIHLNYQPPTVRHSFTELALSRPHNAPDMCYTEPFQLFSEEGVRMMRRELFQKEFLDKYMRSWQRAPCYIGGHTGTDGTANFIKQAWYHPVTQAAINDAFGAALRPLNRENDVGYVNVQLGAEGLSGVYKYTDTPSKPLPSSEIAAAIAQSQFDNVPIDAWHKDQNPVVCVLMLSDTSTMEGGETAIKTGDGRIVKSRGASMGGAVLMQGGHTEHAAMRASNCAERISMVTSYCFANPDADDSSTSLKNVDIFNDNMPRIRHVLMEHKLKKLRGRIDLALDRIEQQRLAGQAPAREDVEPWVKDQITLLKQTAWELFERWPTYGANDIPQGLLKDYLNDV